MSTLTPYAWNNGEWQPADQATLPANDLAIQRGYGIFDFFKVVDGEPVFLEDHLDRFYRSANAMHLQPVPKRETLRNIIRELIVRNQLHEAGIKLTLTGGPSADGYALGIPHLLVSSSPLQLERKMGGALHLMTDLHQRQMPTVKTIDYLRAIWLQPALKKAGADDILYHTGKQVTECPRANFFIVTANGAVQTPKTAVLAGITRKKLLEQGFATEKDFDLNTVYDSAEAFVTSTTKMIRPVTLIDGRKIGNGLPGPVTTALAAAFYQQVFPQTLA